MGWHQPERSGGGSRTARRGLEACAGRLDGIWSDDAKIREGADSQPAAQVFLDARRELDWPGLYFGGVAFKHQREVPKAQLGLAASTAAGFMDVVCTSGRGTGYAADVEKVIAMREGLGPDHRHRAASLTRTSDGDF